MPACQPAAKPITFPWFDRHVPRRAAAAALVIAAAASIAAPPTPELTPEHAAIQAEAKQRLHMRVPVSEPWQTLTPGRLQAILSGDAAAAFERNAQSLLIDQAGAWDLLHFDNPSDVLASWRRWRPNDAALQPVPAQQGGRGQPQRSSHFYADAPYSDEAGAFMALWNCLPSAAWVVHDAEPMLWVMRTGGGWQQPNTFDFGACVRKQSEDGRPPWPSLPDTPRGARSAAVLERKLAATLRQQRCSGRGPDDCLTLLEALASLAPSHPELSALAQALASDFEPQPAAALPPALRERRGRLQPAEYQAAQLAREDAMRQVLYANLWLRVLAAAPAAAVPEGEPKRSLGRLLALSTELDGLDAVQGTLYPQPRIDAQRSIANPWAMIAAALPQHPDWHQALARLGAEAAQRDGCEVAALRARLPSLPSGYWDGFAIDRLLTTGDSCGTLAQSGLRQAYAAAGVGDAASAALRRFERLRPLLGNEAHARAHVELVAELGPACPLVHDPWQLCLWIPDAEPERQAHGTRRLPLRRADRFALHVPASLAAVREGTPPQRVAAALSALRHQRPLAAPVAAMIVQPLQAQGLVVDVTGLWSHPRHPLMAWQLALTTADGSPAEGGASAGALLIVGRTSARLVHLPGGWGQYDNGSVAALSDIDGDGRLEVWSVGTWGECDGEDSRPGVNCSIDTFQLSGEQFGDRLIPYRPGRPPQ